ncbi:MAG: methyltransferase domain-containing protein [Candidatus Eisenbacteria bacterium]
MAIDEILPILCCPDCGADLAEKAGGLSCSSCESRFEVRDSVPLLYPRTMDRSHLREEEHLAETMRTWADSGENPFSQGQWHRSREEFWHLVRSVLKPPPGMVVNVGCGSDTHFRELEEAGYRVVNFDLVVGWLNPVRGMTGAETYVAGDMMRLPFRKGSFDGVLSLDVIHHEYRAVPDLLRSFADLLKPGGTLVLADPNAWGFYQLPKSLLLPKPFYRFLRSAYHRFKGSSHRPADYEFPTSVGKTKKILGGLGFSEIHVRENDAYPAIGPLRYRFYRLFAGSAFVRRYHNYHYMLWARKEGTPG